MIQEILKAFLLIFIAEMGDKTQILAMAFATRYSVRKVLLGVMIGSFLNHGIAVALGSQLTRLVPMDTIQVIAGAAFVGFGIWSLWMGAEDEEEEAGAKYGAVVTVALAFFIGELGDKTQLTAITLAADSTMPMSVLAGTVSGMVVTSSLGIFVGRKLGDRIPEIAIKTVAALVFLMFGTFKLYNSAPDTLLSPVSVSVYILVLAVIVAVLYRRAYVIYRTGTVTSYVHVSQELHDYYASLEKKVERLCLGPEKCGKCEGRRCPVGDTKAIVKQAMSGEPDNMEKVPLDLDVAMRKDFDKKLIREIVKETTKAIEEAEEEHSDDLEHILEDMESIRKDARSSEDND